MQELQRVFFKELCYEDIPYFLDWYNDPEVLKFINTIGSVTQQSEEQWINDMLAERKETDKVFTIVDQKTNLPIGNCGLHKIDQSNRSAQISMVIGNKNYWSKGFGTECCKLLVKYGFDNRNLHRIYTSVYDFNTRSIRQLEKVGFVREGCQRQALFRDGKFHDIILFGLLCTDKLLE